MDRRSSWLMWVGLLVLVSGCATQAPQHTGDTGGTAEATADADVREAISQAWADHIDGAKRKDLAAVVRFYTDDVTYVIPGSQQAVGREEIDALEAQALVAADVIDAKHSIEALEVYGDVAYELGSVVGPVQPQGEEANIISFHFMAMWQRQGDGSWRVRSLVGLPEPVAPQAKAAGKG